MKPPNDDKHGEWLGDVHAVEINGKKFTTDQIIINQEIVEQLKEWDRMLVKDMKNQSIVGYNIHLAIQKILEYEE